MKRSVVGLLMAVLTFGISWGCGGASEPAAATPADSVQVLRQMSDTLAQARQLTFTATRQLDRPLAEANGLPESAEITVVVSRPSKIQATSIADAGVRRFFADGQTITLSDDTMLLYASVPLSGSIDDMLDKLDDTYGFAPPLADFAGNDPYQRFKRQIQASAYQARETVNGMECDHVTVTGEIADADIWVSTSDHLPRRFIATFKDREGAPRLTINFSAWNLSAQLDDSLFVFTPPKGAEKIEMLAIADVQPGADVGGRTEAGRGGRK